jgi:hypothetical protein
VIHEADNTSADPERVRKAMSPEPMELDGGLQAAEMASREEVGGELETPVPKDRSGSEEAAPRS